jgi:hypothetical protein
MFGVTDDCKVMCIGLCTSDSKGSKSCISNSFTKENNFDDNINFVEDLPIIIHGQFGFNYPSGFREEAF